MAEAENNGHPISSGIKSAALDDEDPTSCRPSSRMSPTMIPTMVQMAPQTISPLFILPAELRLSIYEVLWTPSDTESLASSNPASNDLNLLLTCRQAHHEARRIAFERHTFTLWCNNVDRPHFTESLRSPHMYIRSIMLPSQSRIPHPRGGNLINRLVPLIRCLTSLTTILLKTPWQGAIQRRLMSICAMHAYRRKKATRMPEFTFEPKYGLKKVQGKWRWWVGLLEREEGRMSRGVELIIVEDKAYQPEVPE